jgi:hypothetical protein
LIHFSPTAKEERVRISPPHCISFSQYRKRMASFGFLSKNMHYLRDDCGLVRCVYTIRHFEKYGTIFGSCLSDGFT